MDVAEALTRAEAPINSADGAAAADTVVAVIDLPPPLAAGAAGTST